MRDFGLPGACGCRPANRRLRVAPATLAPASLRALGRPLPAPGRHSPHLSARSEDRGGRLVWPHYIAAALELCRGTIHLASLLDCFDTLAPSDRPRSCDELEQAQLRLVGLWKQKQLVSRRLLGYDTTNFYTYVASTNTQNHLAQRGHNKQAGTICVKWTQLRVGWRAWPEFVSPRLAATYRMWKSSRSRWHACWHAGSKSDRAGHVTLVFDKGSAPCQYVELERSEVG